MSPIINSLRDDLAALHDVGSVSQETMFGFNAFCRPGQLMDNLSSLQQIIAGDPVRWRLLHLVHSLGLPDCWIAAGFVRNAVWDHLHGRELSPLNTDVDVIWFDPEHCAPSHEHTAQAALQRLDPTVRWSVKNQARMHSPNGDRPYLSSTDAMRYWPETATAVAVRLGPEGTCEVSAPLGLDDLFRLVIRPTPRFSREKQDIFQGRFSSKNWLTTWPLLRLDPSPYSPTDDKA